MPTPCFFLEATGEQEVRLRRFVHGVSAGELPDQRHRPCREGATWASGYRQGCDASSEPIGRVQAVYDEEGIRQSVEVVARDDPRWPAGCEACGCPFGPDDPWQTNGDPIYRVVAVAPGAALEVGVETTISTAPGGAMWFSPWRPEWRRGFDGRSLVVKLPNGHEWAVDAEANNCTRKGDRTHRCWLRHGEPPIVTVDKDGSVTGQQTCAAGAGSILAGDYHGFLRDGILT